MRTIIPICFLLLSSCTPRGDESERALKEGMRIDGRRRFGEDAQDHHDRVSAAAWNIVEPIRSVDTLANLVRRCEFKLRQRFDERSALSEVKMLAVDRLAQIGGDHAAQTLVGLRRDDLNWDGESGFRMACAIVECGATVLPYLDRWEREEADSSAAELSRMIREGRHPMGLD